jgi:hypothetical protein
LFTFSSTETICDLYSDNWNGLPAVTDLWPAAESHTCTETPRLQDRSPHLLSHVPVTWSQRAGAVDDSLSFILRQYDQRIVKRDLINAGDVATSLR